MSESIGIAVANQPLRRRMRAKKITNFGDIKIDYSWSFAEAKVTDTAYITHGFYTYPAKFIPQLARRLILEYSKEGELVVDPFMGSGTTIVEAMVHNRIGVGVDINDIAAFVSKVKTTPINAARLDVACANLLGNLRNGRIEAAAAYKAIQLPERVNYWFLPENKERLQILLHAIRQVDNAKIRNFMLVGFAQILKSCSIWMQKSVKPTRDPNKMVIDPWEKFAQQLRKMQKRNMEFCELLKKNTLGGAKVYNQDCRNMPCKNNEAALVVTSPPYVTSYEYADLHQLPSLWFGYLKELDTFRQKFVGSQGRSRAVRLIHSDVAENIVAALGINKQARAVRSYFADMYESFEEMYRMLRPGGKAAIVIGNTKLRGVEIANAEVFAEQMHRLGFRIHDVVKREIPSKMLPSTRDKITGRFAKTSHDKKMLAYPTEYILVMEKPE